MFELRPLKIEDLLELNDKIMESRNNIHSLIIQLATNLTNKSVLKPCYTYLKDDKVVACFGEVHSEPDIIDVWTLYSNKASCFTRARAAMAFCKLINDTPKTVRVSIPSDLPNGRKYAEFLGLISKRTCKLIAEEPSKIWAGIKNSIYIYEAV